MKNEMQGHGHIYFGAGGYLEGFFEKSKVCGKAVLVFANHDMYFGNWKAGKMDGLISKWL